MKTTELRIGNHVSQINDKHDGVYRIIEIYNSSVRLFDFSAMKASYNLDIERLVPVPLNEKYLQNFEKGNEIIIPSDYSVSIERYKEKYFLFDTDFGSIGIEIKHVHQLQNLFFALTGEDLQVK